MPPLTLFTRLAVIVAGILGAAGIAAAAGATHTGDEALLGPLSLIALTHASTILALGLYAPASRLLRTATTILAAGALIFCADLALRHFTGNALFPMSAPLGGGAMIAGWVLLIPAAFTLPRAKT